MEVRPQLAGLTSYKPMGRDPGFSSSGHERTGKAHQTFPVECPPHLGFAGAEDHEAVPTRHFGDFAGMEEPVRLRVRRQL